MILSNLTFCFIKPYVSLSKTIRFAPPNHTFHAAIPYVLPCQTIPFTHQLYALQRQVIRFTLQNLTSCPVKPHASPTSHTSYNAKSYALRYKNFSFALPSHTLLRHKTLTFALRALIPRAVLMHFLPTFCPKFTPENAEFCPKKSHSFRTKCRIFYTRKIKKITLESPFLPLKYFTFHCTTPHFPYKNSTHFAP